MNHPPASALEFCLETVRSGRHWLIVFGAAIAAMWVHIVWLHHSIAKRFDERERTKAG